MLGTLARYGENNAMYIVYFRQGQWAVAWRYSSGEKHFIAFYPDRPAAARAATRMNGDYIPGERDDQPAHGQVAG